MEQIKIFRYLVAEDIERNANSWLASQPDIEVVEASLVYEPPRPTRSSNEVPDEEAWLMLVRFRTNGKG